MSANCLHLANSCYSPIWPTNFTTGVAIHFWTRVEWYPPGVCLFHCLWCAVDYWCCQNTGSLLYTEVKASYGNMLLLYSTSTWKPLRGGHKSTPPEMVMSYWICATPSVDLDPELRMAMMAAEFLIKQNDAYKTADGRRLHLSGDLTAKSSNQSWRHCHNLKSVMEIICNCSVLSLLEGTRFLANWNLLLGLGIASSW